MNFQKKARLPPTRRAERVARALRGEAVAGLARQLRRRGLAMTVAAALILYCLEHGLEPGWDAANEPSAALARQLGFHSTGKYEAYRLEEPAGKGAAN